MVRSKLFDQSLSLVLIVSAVIMLYIISGLFRPLHAQQLLGVILEKETVTSMVISLSSILVSMVAVASIGTFLAYKLHNKKGRLYEWLHGLILFPLLLPPTVAGLVLLQGFGRNGLLSYVLFGQNLHIAFSFMAIVLTQVYVTLPFFYQMTRNAFEDIEGSCIEAASVAGAPPYIILKDIMIPISIRSMGAGLFMSALRGLSEFGATIMFAGNLVGKTQTMTTRIYQLYQSDMNAALVLAGFQLCLFLVPYYLFIRKSKYMGME